ncbi:MAG: glycosyltransferase, partial [Actinomycetota bacterium]
SVGVPVVSVDVGGVREIVEDGVTGIIVRDEAQLAEAVSQLTGDAARRQKSGEQARSLITERCSLAKYLEAHAALYERLVAR